MELRNSAVSDEDTLRPEHEQNEQQEDALLAGENSTVEETPATREGGDSITIETEDKATPNNIVHKNNNSDDDDDDHIGDEDLGSVSGGFLGDFEEIDEDEDVQRFISLNHTPLTSARQSPAAPLHMPSKTGRGSEQMDVDENDSGEDSDASFESIPNITARSTATDVDTTVESSAVGIIIEKTAASETAGGENSTVQEAPRLTKYNGTETSLERLNALQEEFRDRFVPKLADGMFFSLDVYKRYTVVSPPSQALNGGKLGGSVSGSTEIADKLAPATQKPSSLRRNNNTLSVANPKSGLNSAVTSDSERTGPKSHDVGDSANATGGVGATVQPLSPSKAKRPNTSIDDDVVGTLLGAMKSPGIGSSTQQQTKPSSAQQQGIPDDMLAAMMAIEGINATEMPKPAATRTTNPLISAKKFAKKLTDGYRGPFSQLTIAEHAHYLGLVQKVRSGQLSAKEGTEYQRFKTKIDTEQLKFRTQAREKAFPLLRRISEPVNQTAQKRVAELSGRALDHYARRYTPVRVAAIRSSASGYVPLVYKETLLQRGRCYGVQVPDAESVRAEGAIPTTADPWDYMQPDAGPRRQTGVPVTSDAVALKLAHLTQADVVVSASSLIALLTLPQSYLRDVAIPFKTIALQTEKPILVVDKPLVSAHASTPRKLNQLFYEASTSSILADRTQKLELGGGTRIGDVGEASGDERSSSAELGAPDNDNYTLWEFGDLRVIVRYSVHGFHALESSNGSGGPGGSDGADEAKQPLTTTVTLKTKTEYHLANSSAEVAVAACGGAKHSDGGAFEDITESERLAWWMSSYLRGSPSEVWVSHVNVQKSAIARTTKHKCADLFPGTVACAEPGGAAAASGPKPSTRGLLALLQDLLRQSPGDYMLDHKRRTWDATIYRALDRQPDGVSPPPALAIMNLEDELQAPSVADPTQLDLEGDY
ncbi:hypothetical protein EV175_003939, partial [Coemansia sp. RSA 1933]